MRNEEIIILCKKKLIEEMKKNSILEKKLKIAESWMHKEVENKIKEISKQKIKVEKKDIPLEEKIRENIINYFWEVLLLNAPSWMIESLITSEINFDNVIKMDLDWFSVIWWYHKVLDLLVENIITKNFRKYAKKQGQIILRMNDPLEKSIHLVVNKWYILSAWRLFALMKIVNESGYGWDYVESFKDFVKKYEDIENLLTDRKFYKNFEKLNELEVLSTKRHSWTINKEDTLKARKIFIWDYKDKNSILYKLLEAWSISI